MKTLRLIGMVLFAVLMCVNFASCSSEENEVIQDGEKVLVSLGFGGDYEISESPLSRETSENNDLYYIEVHGADVSFKAYGLFDNIDNISIELIQGKTYNFSTWVIKDGKTKLKNEGSVYSTPFYRREITNSFSNISSGPDKEVFVLADENEYYIANIETFYGSKSNYKAVKNEEVTISTFRFEAFGAEFIVNYFDEGQLEITLEKEVDNSITLQSPTLVISYPTTSISEIFSVLFYNEDTYLFTTVGTGDTAYYALEAKVNINWIKTDGTKVSLGTPTISFKKNYNTTIKINVDKSINNGITIDIDENGLEDAETYIVDDGNASVEE